MMTKVMMKVMMMMIKELTMLNVLLNQNDG